MTETMNAFRSEALVADGESARLVDESSWRQADVDLPRVTDIVLEFSEELSKLAEAGYGRQGRGAIVFCENLVPSLEAMIPFYLPATDPELDEVAPEVREAVDIYDPRIECVVYFVSEAECSYLFLLDVDAHRESECKPRYH